MDSGSALHPRRTATIGGKDLLDRVGRSFGAAGGGESGAWCGWKQEKRESNRGREKEEEEEGGIKGPVWFFFPAFARSVCVNKPTTIPPPNPPPEN